MKEQESTLFGGLVKMQTPLTIEDGALKDSVLVSRSISLTIHHDSAGYFRLHHEFVRPKISKNLIELDVIEKIITVHPFDDGKGFYRRLRSFKHNITRESSIPIVCRAAFFLISKRVPLKALEEYNIKNYL